MATLINVDNQQGDKPKSARPISCTLSSTKATGVSVGNALSHEASWYVLRVSYHRELKAQEWLMARNIEAYLPLRHALKMVDGKRKHVSETLIPNLLFVHATADDLEHVLSDAANTCLSYYYDHFRLLPDGKNPPLVVPDTQMVNFIRLTSVADPNILFVSHDECRFKSGDKVVVTSGPFKGVVGRVVRAKRQQRVAVEIDGIGCITTAYVPSGCMEKIIKEP